jgi:hypothetical protein
LKGQRPDHLHCALIAEQAARVELLGVKEPIPWFDAERPDCLRDRRLAVVKSIWRMTVAFKDQRGVCRSYSQRVHGDARSD